MKKFFFTLIFIFLISNLYASKPMIGIAVIDGNTPRTIGNKKFLIDHLINITYSTGVFDTLNTKLLMKELGKFDCLDDKCLIRFAKNAGISLLIKGDLNDKGEYVILSLYCYGIDTPYNGKLMYKYVVQIPTVGKYKSRDFSYIFEEHAGIFISKFLKGYKKPVYLTIENGKVQDVENFIDGNYSFYRYALKQEKELYGKVGTLKIKNGKITGGKINLIKQDDFILVTYTDKSNFLKNFYYGRKKEVIFNKPKATDTLLKILFTAPASALMPIAAPLLGYYRNKDWLGLGLWALNATPYIYIEINGFIHHPKSYKKNKENVPRVAITQWRFAWYFLFTGGGALFVDAFAQEYLSNAANYRGIQPFMGNSVSAGYLALVSSGAGHFYRGNRFWGYFYFHLNNLLFYFTLREFSPTETYDPQKKKYVKGTVNEIKAYTLVSVLCALKVTEIIHAVLMKDRIRNGKILEDSFTIEPVVSYYGEEDINFGLQYSYRF